MNARNIAALLFIVFAASLPASAEKAAPLGELEKVFQNKDFGIEKEKWKIIPREKKESAKEAPAPPSFEFLKTLSAYILRALVLCAVAALFVMVIIFARKIKFKRRARREAEVHESAAQEADVRKTLERAAASYKAGDVRGAFSFCFNAALICLGKTAGVRLPPDFTEYECLAALKARAGNDAEGFARLVDYRVRSAYMGTEPDAAAFSDAYNFCENLAGRAA